MLLDDLLTKLGIGEDQDLEFKSADGGLPKSLWETLSAFANTEGGHIVLGVAKRDEKYEAAGVKNIDGLRKSFWDGHNNPQKVSGPICKESNFEILNVDGRKVIVIYIARADRRARPVYINGNPITGTFKRNYEGDYRCSESEIRQMLRDASELPLDALVLDGYGFDDLDAPTLRAYRNRFSSRDPDHPFLAFDDLDLLRKLGGLGKDRGSQREGVTLAGLLMFGKERSLIDALPQFHLDYQERKSKDPEERWTHRITLDGKWEANLFNFYFRVYPRLVENLDVPFKLDAAAVRVGETHVHEALREALVNTLIHSDHQSSRPLTVLKTPTDFAFTNPGLLRIPRTVLYQGGVSDPRNPNLQRMFQMIGLGEKAGSGFQKILRAWNEQQWLMPAAAEHPTLEMTRVLLPLASMIPEAVESELRGVLGEKYGELDQLDRLVLAVAHRFGEIGNADIQVYRPEHPREIGERLKGLVSRGCLDKDGHGRGTRYRLAGTPAQGVLGLSIAEAAGSEQMPAGSEHSGISSEHYNRLSALAKPIKAKGRVGKLLMRETILKLCQHDFLTLRTLADLLDRAPDSIRNHYISGMLEDGAIELRYPDTPNHPNQGYRSSVNSAS